MSNFSYLPNRSPPASEVGVWSWLRRNLFSSPLYVVLTALAVYALYRIVPPIFNWAIWTATFRGTTAADCTSGGACWVFIKMRVNQFLYGFYPESEYWRVWLLFLVIVPATFLTLWFGRKQVRVWTMVFALLVLPALSWFLLRGGVFGLAEVRSNLWGGMMLTLVVASAGLVFSLPLGILLALGRVSDMPLLRWCCIAFIELWRGVPLVTVLFMANVMLPLFLPPQVHIDNLIRALIGVALFASAYMAEVIRGGLQAIPHGQYEAADSLGLGYWAKMRLVVLPQALVTVIPGITNTFVGLFKDTTLVSIIGLFDFLGIVHSAGQDPDWLGHGMEGYVFCAVVYFLFCYGMSHTSYRIERHFTPEHA
ncbi:MAG: amino acid ABC transporter permease [Cardiobacteriaceae bacterium]|nr:amino acid ABC transporter permease [Cardiobacteriaceae bacterium]